MQDPHVLPQPPPGLEQPVPPPELAAYSHLLTNVNSSSSHTQQPPVSTTHVGTHPVPTALSAKRSASTAPAGTITLSGNPSPTDLVTLTQLTATSCTINSDFPSFSGIQARRAEILPTSSLPPVVGFMQLSFRKASDHVPHISDQFRVYTDNMDLAILLNKDTFEPDPTVLTFKADSTSKGTWGMVLLIVRALLRAPVSFRHTYSHIFARYISTMWWPRNVTHPLSFFNSFMPKCGSTMSTSLVVTST